MTHTDNTLLAAGCTIEGMTERLSEALNGVSEVEAILTVGLRAEPASELVGGALAALTEARASLVRAQVSLWLADKQLTAQRIQDTEELS